MVSGVRRGRYRGSRLASPGNTGENSSLGMGDFEIRDARDGDAEALARLMRDEGYPTSTEEMRSRFARISAHPYYDTLVAERGGRVVGALGMTVGHLYERNEDHAQIVALVVDPKHRARGAGRALVEAAENRARRWGVRQIVLSSGVDRAEAHRFYGAIGYEATGYRFSRSLEKPPERRDLPAGGRPAALWRGNSWPHRIGVVTLVAGAGLVGFLVLSMMFNFLMSGNGIALLTTLLILAALVLPAVAVTRRLRSRNDREQRTILPTEREVSAERELLDVLKERGELTPTSAAMLTTLTVSEATQLLREMARKDYLETRVQDGFLVYAVPDPDRKWLEDPAPAREPDAHPFTEDPNPESPAESLDEPLSEREREVLKLLATGRSNREIAQDLFVAPGTVKAHINNIYRKLGARNRAEALVRARDLDLEG